MFENILNFFKNLRKNEKSQGKEKGKSKDAAKERLHLVLMQDRANVSADFLDLMKQEIIEVIKKYIEVDENAIDVRLTNKDNGDGTNGAPALYANIPIKNIKDEVKSGMAREKKVEKELLNTEPKEETKNEEKEQTNKEEVKESDNSTEQENKDESNKEQEVKENNNNNSNNGQTVEKKEEQQPSQQKNN